MISMELSDKEAAIIASRHYERKAAEAVEELTNWADRNENYFHKDYNRNGIEETYKGLLNISEIILRRKLDREEKEREERNETHSK